jgi:hypothetical protein
MIKTSDLPAIFCRKPILLVVEDMLAKEYLLHSWGAEQKHFEVITAGGHDVVHGCVTHLRKHGALNAYCVVDRDFGSPNMATWRDPSIPDLRGTHHEIENYLLDWDALEGCEINQMGRKHTAAEIHSWAKAEADKQVYWLACRKVLHDIKHKIDFGFPEHPKIDEVKSEAEAIGYIVGAPWRTSLLARASDIVNNNQLAGAISGAVATYQACLANNTWHIEFSGKEIFRAIRGRIYNSSRANDNMPDETVANSVARWQAARSCVPAEITELCSALKHRVGLR